MKIIAIYITLLISILASAENCEPKSSMFRGLTCFHNEREFITLESFKGHDSKTLPHHDTVCEGFLKVEYNDVYSFALNTDEASLLIDYDLKIKKVYLKKGLHHIEVRYKEIPYLEWSNSVTPFTIVPSDHFWRKE